LLLSLTLRPPTSPLFPYTTLFRSPDDLDSAQIGGAGILHLTGITPALSRSAHETVCAAIEIARASGVLVSLDLNYRAALWDASRSEEHTSELQSRFDLVCRLLLEK